MRYPLPLPKSKHKKKRVIVVHLNANQVLTKEWDDGFANQHIPDYKVYEDKFC
jgi:hypothetical protein